MSLDCFARFIFLWLLLFSGCAFETKYPAHWWEKGESKEEVLLTPKNELGILLHTAATPFWFKGKRYASAEGFIQMLKYPELNKDPRNNAKLPYSRDEVASLSGEEASKAGAAADAMMKELHIDWVTFEGEKMDECSANRGEHYRLIKDIMIKKMRYNPEVRRVLLATAKLKLRIDQNNKVKDCQAPEKKYHELWMEIREDYMRGRFLAPFMLQ